jgi:cell division ATPase FtsA
VFSWAETRSDSRYCQGSHSTKTGSLAFAEEKTTTTSKKRIQEIVEARIMDMLEIIKKKLSTWNKDRLLPGGIVLIGDGSQHEHIDTYTRNYLKLPVQLMQTDKIIPSKRGLDASWFAVYGLCFLGDQQPQYRATGVNLKKLLKDTRGTIKGFFEQFLP